MPRKTPQAFGILDFVLTHSATHTLAKIASLAGVPSTNIRSGLQGQRGIKLPHVAQLAAAVGLQLQVADSHDVDLVLGGGTVLHLAVGFDEILLAIQKVTPLTTKPPEWRFIHAKGADGTYLTALAHMEVGRYARRQHGYVALHITDPINKLRRAALQEQLEERLGGTVEIPDASLDVEAIQWIRLRSGLHSAPELDAIYKAKPDEIQQPTALDWAEVFRLAAQLGMGPGDITQAMRDQDLARRPRG